MKWFIIFIAFFLFMTIGSQITWNYGERLHEEEREKQKKKTE